MIDLVAGLVLFLGIHSVAIFASDWRDRMLAAVKGWALAHLIANGMLADRLGVPPLVF